MTKKIYLPVSIALIAAYAAGCSPHANNRSKMLAQQETLRQTQAQQQQQQQDQTPQIGGQPGKVEVYGVAISSDGKLDSHVSLTQSGGTGLVDDKPTDVDVKHQPVLSSTVQATASTKDLQASKTFINIGCQDPKQLSTDGLTESTYKPSTGSAIAITSVTKLFICGEHVISPTLFVYNADEIYLNNAQLTLTASYGALMLSANTLHLDGANTVSLSGVPSVAPVEEGPSLNLTVIKEIQGNGTLAIDSKGGSCQAPLVGSGGH